MKKQNFSFETKTCRKMKSSITKKSMYQQCSSIGRFVSLYTADATKKTQQTIYKEPIFLWLPKASLQFLVKA